MRVEKVVDLMGVSPAGPVFLSDPAVSETFASESHTI